MKFRAFVPLVCLLAGCASTARVETLERRLRILEHREEALKACLPARCSASDLDFIWGALDASEEIERLSDEGVKEIRRYCTLPWRCK